MAFISVTRLRIRSPWFLPAFFYYAVRSQAQAKRAEGNLGVAVLNDARRTFWTKSAWRDREAMRAYLLSGVHKRAMPKLMEWCDEAAVADWVQTSAELPDWGEAHRRMVAEGRRSKVRRPSAGQERFAIPAPRVRTAAGAR